MMAIRTLVCAPTTHGRTQPNFSDSLLHIARKHDKDKYSSEKATRKHMEKNENIYIYMRPFPSIPIPSTWRTNERSFSFVSYSKCTDTSSLGAICRLHHQTASIAIRDVLQTNCRWRVCVCARSCFGLSVCRVEYKSNSACGLYAHTIRKCAVQHHIKRHRRR